MPICTDFWCLYINEVVPAAAVEDDECRIIKEKTIFDHVREKAKNL